jgi:hypothetical protein
MAGKFTGVCRQKFGFVERWAMLWRSTAGARPGIAEFSPTVSKMSTLDRIWSCGHGQAAAESLA